MATELADARSSAASSGPGGVLDRAVLDAGRRPRAGGDLHLHPTPALPAVARGFEGEQALAALVVTAGE
jgi:hypothetical protein